MSDHTKGDNSFEAVRDALLAAGIETYVKDQVDESAVATRLNRCCDRCDGHPEEYPLRELYFSGLGQSVYCLRECVETRVTDEEDCCYFVPPYDVTGVRLCLMHSGEVPPDAHPLSAS